MNHTSAMPPGRVGAAVAVGLFLLSLVFISAVIFRLSFHPASPDALVSSTYSMTPRSAREDTQDSVQLKDWHSVDELDLELAQFHTVFWEPKDTESLRKWIIESGEIAGKTVLEIGTGTGLVAITCLLSDAKRVVATDINPSAYLNARYNADHLGLARHLDVRLVDPATPAPFSTVGDDEKFDVIISNPPWEDQPVSEVAAYALYDQGFALLDGILQQSASHLRPEGKLLLAYGSRQAIQRILDTASEFGWTVQIADPRRLQELPEVFVPGMLLILEREE